VRVKIAHMCLSAHIYIYIYIYVFIYIYMFTHMFTHNVADCVITNFVITVYLLYREGNIYTRKFTKINFIRGKKNLTN